MSQQSVAELLVKDDSQPVVYEQFGVKDLEAFLNQRYIPLPSSITRTYKERCITRLEAADRTAIFPLYELPAELRQKIYREAVTTTVSIPLNNKHGFPFPHIVGVSKMVRQEALPVFYDSNTFQARIRANQRDVSTSKVDPPEWILKMPTNFNEAALHMIVELRWDFSFNNNSQMRGNAKIETEFDTHERKSKHDSCALPRVSELRVVRYRPYNKIQVDMGLAEAVRAVIKVWVGQSGEKKALDTFLLDLAETANDCFKDGQIGRIIR